MTLHAFPLRAPALLGLCLAAALAPARAATDTGSQFLDLIPAADETSMTLVWYPPVDDFGPTPPCAQTAYTVTVYNDGVLAAKFSTKDSPLTNLNGPCRLEKTLTSGAAYTSKISPGIWTAYAQKNYNPSVSDTETIYACTAKQGKQPMYRLVHAAYTDNFYTTSASDRATALSIGYTDGGVPFSMPLQVRFGSRPFYRLFKGAPQLEHFYTASDADRDWTMQQGYSYEGIEGYVFANQKPGTLPLYRFSQYNGSTGDLQHYYTLWLNDPQAYGLGYDGLAGYACVP